MTTVTLLLLITAAVCFLLAALGVTVRRVRLGWLGLLAWVLLPLIDAVRGLP
jgi:hypothetical protein